MFDGFDVFDEFDELLCLTTFIPERIPDSKLLRQKTHLVLVGKHTF